MERKAALPAIGRHQLIRYSSGVSGEVISEASSENDRVPLPVVRRTFLLLVILALVAAWQWTPLRQWRSVLLHAGKL